MDENNNQSSGDKDSLISLKRDHWYRDVSILIPLMALIFTLFTSLISYVESSHDDYLASRTELRGLINELIKMNEDFAEITAKYSNNPDVLSGLSAQYNTKNSILAQQASSVVNRLEGSYFGKNTVLDVEYMAIGQALSSSYLYDEALIFYRKGSLRANDSAIAAGALRAIAGIYMIKGDVEDMRSKMLAATEIYSVPKFENDIDFKKKITNITTLIQWAQSEVTLGNCDYAKQKLDSAKQILPFIPSSPIKSQLVGQSKYLTDAVSSCLKITSMKSEE